MRRAICGSFKVHLDLQLVSAGNRDLVPLDKELVQNAGTINVAVLAVQPFGCSSSDVAVADRRVYGRPRVAHFLVSSCTGVTFCAGKAEINKQNNNSVVIYLCIHVSLIASSLLQHSSLSLVELNWLPSTVIITPVSSVDRHHRRFT